MKSSKERNKRKRSSFSLPKLDRVLLGVFLSAVFIISISIILVPQTLESSTDYMLASEQNRPHSFAAKLKEQSSSAKTLSNKNSVDGKNSLTGKQNHEFKSKSIADIGEKGNKSEAFFLTHSSPFHTIFSTGCSIFQDWQSYVFFYHVFQSGQEGHITRIASGCKKDEEIKLQEMFEREIKAMRADLHHLHLTPDFSRIPKKKKGSFKYFNKPFGVLHWMEKALGYPENHELHDDSIIILMDPDQIMLRPFTGDFTNSSESWRSAKKRKLIVEHGSPFAQQYGYGMQPFKQVKPENVFLGKNFPTPVSNLTKEEKNVYYFSMGPVSESALPSQNIIKKI